MNTQLPMFPDKAPTPMPGEAELAGWLERNDWGIHDVSEADIAAARVDGDPFVPATPELLAVFMLNNCQHCQHCQQQAGCLILEMDVDGIPLLEEIISQHNYTERYRQFPEVKSWRYSKPSSAAAVAVCADRIPTYSTEGETQ